MKKLLLIIYLWLVALAAFAQTPNYVLPYRTQTRMLQVLQRPASVAVDSLVVFEANGWLATRPFPNWSRLDGKPTLFPTDISNVFGLQTVLDGKQPIGNYLTTSYIPTWTSISGKPYFFSGSYLDLTNVPSVFPSNIANVSGLQSALDGKQSAGSYATSAQLATKQDVLGFVPYNSTNPNGYISSIPAQTWSSITGKPTTLSGYGITDGASVNAVNGKFNIPTGSTSQYIRGDGSLASFPNVTPDSTVFRTTANSLTLAQAQTKLNSKQNALVSGTNIKTVAGISLLGSGDIPLSSNMVVNTATVGLSKSTLNSTYPNAPMGYMVFCPNIILGGAIYIKNNSATGSGGNWQTISAPPTL